MTLVDLRVGLRAYLLADSAISTQAGGNRVYPVKLPQGQVQPSIVYTRISGLGDHHSQGASGLNRVRVQIDCYAQAADTADLLARRVKERIDGFRGSMEWDEGSPGNAVVAQGVFFDSEREDWDEASGLYRVSHDYFVWFEEH